MKKIMTALLAAAMIFSAFVLASCSENTDSTPKGMKLASGEAASYLFYVPETWQCDVASGATSAYYSNSDTSSVNVMTFSLGYSDASVSDWWSSFEADFKKVYEDFEVISREETTLDGEAAEKVVFKGSLTHDEEKVEFKFMQISAIKRKMLSSPEVYVITYTSSPEIYDNHLSEVDKMIENFKFN